MFKLYYETRRLSSLGEYFISSSFYLINKHLFHFILECTQTFEKDILIRNTFGNKLLSKCGFYVYGDLYSKAIVSK